MNSKKILFFSILIFLLYSFCSFKNWKDVSQYDNSLCNKIDSLGIRNGIWIEKEDASIVEFYRRGKLQGASMLFNSSSQKIVLLAQYEDGKPVGPMLMCSDDGTVIWLATKFLPNTDFIGSQKNYDKTASFPYQSYSYKFDELGRIKCEGWEIFGEEFIMDSEKVGTWKYYDENGNCELVDFSKDDIDDKYSRY